MPIYEQDMSENDFFDCGRKISILLDFYRHLLLINLNKAQIKQENSNLPQTKHYETFFSPFLVAVTLITIVTVKPHPTMGKGGRWVKARSP